MEFRFTLFLILIVSSFCTAQTVPSSCTAPDSVLRMYRRDAQGLALDRIIRYNSPYADTVLIPDAWTDSILRAMVAVYNANSLPARDSVVAYYKVHSYYHAAALGTHTIEVDNPLPGWMMDFKSKIFPTRDTAINNLMTKYGIVETGYGDLGFGAEVQFSSDSSCNIRGLDSAWNRVVPVTVYNEIYGTGPEIFLDTMTDSVVQLRYRYACGDCPSGCTVWHDWTFRVYNDCSVEYIGSKGYKIEGMDCIQLAVQAVIRPEISVYPNPFSERIIIKGVNKGTEYSINNALGQVCLSGLVDGSGIINTDGLSVGVYFIRLRDGDATTVLKVVKTE